MARSYCGGDGWLTTRSDHADWTPPTVELCVNHFTGVTLATETSSEGGGGGGGGGGCFIATAAYGSIMEKDVVTLRQFRDTYLITNPVGQTLIGLYYRTSPPLAGWIAKHENARTAVRMMLKPVVWVCAFALGSPTLAAFAAILLCGFLLSIGMTRRLARKRVM